MKRISAPKSGVAQNSAFEVCSSAPRGIADLNETGLRLPVAVLERPSSISRSESDSQLRPLPRQGEIVPQPHAALV
jgi:hypothetical protein